MAARLREPVPDIMGIKDIMDIKAVLQSRLAAAVAAVLRERNLPGAPVAAVLKNKLELSVYMLRLCIFRKNPSCLFRQDGF